MRNDDRNKNGHFLQDLFRMGGASTKPTIVDLIVSVFGTAVLGACHLEAATVKIGLLSAACKVLQQCESPPRVPSLEARFLLMLLTLLLKLVAFQNYLWLLFYQVRVKSRSSTEWLPPFRIIRGVNRASSKYINDVISCIDRRSCLKESVLMSYFEQNKPYNAGYYVPGCSLTAADGKPISDRYLMFPKEDENLFTEEKFNLNFWFFHYLPWRSIWRKLSKPILDNNNLHKELLPVNLIDCTRTMGVFCHVPLSISHAVWNCTGKLFQHAYLRTSGWMRGLSSTSDTCCTIPNVMQTKTKPLYTSVIPTLWFKHNFLILIVGRCWPKELY